VQSHLNGKKARLWVVAILTLAAVVVVYLLPPISQPISYHRFADQRRVLHIPNFWNVVTNLPFLFVGLYGLSLTRYSKDYSGIKLIYCLLFFGVLLTGVGSAYYHWHPDNDTLVWDRIPMTTVFMAFLSACLYEFISPSIGFILLFPLVLVGIFSVWWWHHSELIGQGDLRLYALVQFYPALVIPILFWLFYTADLKQVIRCLIWIIVWYAIAKLFEHFDTSIYHLTGVGGHALKHLAAALSTWYLAVLFKIRHIDTFKHQMPHNPDRISKPAQAAGL